MKKLNYLNNDFNLIISYLNFLYRKPPECIFFNILKSLLHTVSKKILKYGGFTVDRDANDKVKAIAL